MDNERDSGLTFKQGFQIGCLLALVYSVMKNPGQFSCCLGLLLLIAVLLVLSLVVVLYDFLWVAGVVALLYVAVRLYQRWRESQRARR